MKKQLLSIVGGKALNHIFRAVPSIYVPFKGKFPLAEDYQVERFYNIVQSVKYLEDIKEEWIQNIIIQGAKISDIEDGFMAWLSERGKLNQFPNLTKEEKADLLVKFMDKNCLDLGALKIN